MTNRTTREQWLLDLVSGLRPMFEPVAPVPESLRVTCGWPSTRAMSKTYRRIGECWRAEASADNVREIFISPCLGDGLEAAAVLVHELVHSTGADGHRRPFSRIAKAVGLVKPWRATTASPELQGRLNALIESVGPYPHAKLDWNQRTHKKDGTRLIKLWCPACGYTVRTTLKWIETGLPICPCGSQFAREVLSEGTPGRA